jgi:ankyrin repeat protein
MIEDFHKACRLADVKSIKTIIKQNPLYRDKIDSKLGWSPLYRSVVCNQPESVRVLIELGADPNIQNRLGESPLHQAASNNFTEIAEILLSNGADVNLAQNDGDTPLHLACTRGHESMVDLLLRFQADPSKVSRVLCKTPADYAMENSHNDILTMMKRQKAKNFSVSDDSNPTKETSFEPESEKTSRSRLGFPSLLMNWLNKHRLDAAYEPLANNGYDDLSLLISAFQSQKVGLKSFENFGILKPGIRMRLAARLDAECHKKPRLSNSKSLSKIAWCVHPPSSPGIGITASIEEVLESLGLRSFSEKFIDSGLDDYDQVLYLMRSKYPITEDFLEKVIGISKIGYRHRILAKLSADSGMRRAKGLSIEKEDLRSACECKIM